MSAPAWFQTVFKQFVVALQQGTYASADDAVTDLWTSITGHSEKQVANALAEVFGSREVPVALNTGITERVHVERIAKYLVNRGTVLDEEPLLPAPVEESRREGVAYLSEEELRRRRPFMAPPRRTGFADDTGRVR